MRKLSILLVVISAFVLSACSVVTSPPVPYDYSNYLESSPHSILVLPPTDTTNEVKASPAVFVHTMYPLAENGYYVFPPALVYETFKNNGLTEPQEIHNVSLKKLREIFGADAVLYVNVDKYGVNYKILDSVTQVMVSAKLVDLRTGKVLWQGSGYAEDADQNSSNNLFIQLAAAAIKQIVNNVSDKGYKVASGATHLMLSSGYNGGILYGPRSLRYHKDPQLSPKQ